MKFIGDKQIAETYIAEQTHFKNMKNLLKIITQLLKGGCPRCGDYYDGEVCQTCGYPWS